MTALDFPRRLGDARFLIHAKWRAFEGGPVSDIPHVLIADDHPLVLGALRQAVSGAIPRAFIHEAVDFESLAVALEQMPDMDLVLLDLSMPGVRGFSGLLFLRAERPSVPVIVVSGNEDRAVIRHCLEFGAAGFIPKSTALETMRDAIVRVLDGGRWTPADFDPNASCSGCSAQTTGSTSSNDQGNEAFQLAFFPGSTYNGVANYDFVYTTGANGSWIDSNTPLNNAMADGTPNGNITG